MTALTANVDSSTTEFPMDEAPPPPGSTWTVGTENIIVRGGRALDEGAFGRPRPSAGIQQRRWIVERGYAGSTAASHLSGATLTRYYPDAAGTVGGGSISATGLQGGTASGTVLQFPGEVTQVDVDTIGVGLVASMLGPFPVDHTEMIEGEINVNGLVITTIPAGSLVLRAGIFVTAYLETTPSHDNPTALQVRLSATGNPAQSVTVARYDPENQTQATAFAEVESGYTASYPTSPTAALAKVDLDLRLFVDAGAEWIGFGSVDVYAIIATPAS